MNSAGFAAVILAAGSSSRMGRDKALLSWGNGTFLTAAIDCLSPFVNTVIVVAGENANLIRAAVKLRGAMMAANPHPERGQFSSMRTGLQAALNLGSDSAIVALVDRPPATSATVETLINHFSSQKRMAKDRAKWAIIPEYEGRHGHPIVIAREMIDCFLEADANSSGREVEHTHQIRLQYVAVDDPNVVANVNTPEEYERLCASIPI
jgi:molybdenum cofactor cytidylyltransferase